MRFQLWILFALASFTLARAQAPSAGTLDELIPALFGVQVIPYRGECAEQLRQAAERTLARLQSDGVIAARPNEVGNAVESILLEALLETGFAADRPIARSGHQRAAGYPDLEARLGGTPFYIEVKTYHPRTESSTQRSFYLSPSNDPKVAHDAIHLLFAFAMEPDETGRYFAKSARIIDLHKLRVHLKMEYNAGNDDLYGEQAGLEVLVLPAE